MKPLEGKVAVVTGASRGVGKGVALGLGEAGATVYITGRTEREGETSVPLGGTIHQTADEVNTLGGVGIAVRCDHANDPETKELFAQVMCEQGRLDILVNNAWRGYEGFHDGRDLAAFQSPFWEQRIEQWDERHTVGVRSAYIASVFAVPIMVAQGSGLIVNISFPVSTDCTGNVSYEVAKLAIDRMTANMAVQLRKYGVATVSLYPGLVRTEGVLLYPNYFDFSNSESPQLSGRAIAALASDQDMIAKSGMMLEVAKLSQEYGFEDIAWEPSVSSIRQ